MSDRYRRPTEGRAPSRRAPHRDYDDRPRPRRRVHPDDQRHRRRRPPPKQRLRKTPIIVMLAIIGVVFFFMFRSPSEEEYTPVITPPIDEETPEEGISFGSLPLSELNDTGYLKLVNRTFAMDREMDYSLLLFAAPTVAARADYITMHRTLLNAVANLFADAVDVPGIGPFFVSSGYRDVARQAEIYNNAYDTLYVMPPGHSEHNLGLAVDISIEGVPMTSHEMSGHPSAIWLRDNAWRHGLILRYPQGMTHITEVAYEPWHFRYVGRIHAWYMAVNDLVLEEYLEQLANRGSIVVPLDGRTYHIFYHRTQAGNLPVPLDMEFTISRSNRGGFVVTTWE